MEKNFKADALNEGILGHKTPLPTNFIAVGETATDDVKVYIKQDVYKNIEALSGSDTANELGSILLGEYMEEAGKIHVVISQYIEAKYTDASASTLTFTHETWDYVHKEHDRNFPQLKIIGWQHTHPNYGIFLSNYDMFIQENFFDMPFQVAYVVDPIQHIRGFFQWKNGKVEKLPGFYIYDEIGKPIKIEQTKQQTETAPKSAKKRTTLFLSLFIMVSLGLILSLIAMNHRLNTQLQQLENLEAVINLQSDGGATQESEPVDGDVKTEGVVLQAYTVKEGDSLWKICAYFGLDYQANQKVIKALNGIENADSIVVGQTILLPLPSAEQ